MGVKKVFYLSSSLMMVSYAYCFDEMYIPSIVLSILNALYLIFIDDFKFKIDLDFLFIWFLNFISLSVNNVEGIYNGILVVSALNCFVSYKIYKKIKYSLYLESLVLNWVILFLIILLLVLVFGKLIFINLVSVIVAVSSIYLPLIMHFIIYRVRINIQKGAKYDTIFSK